MGDDHVLYITTEVTKFVIPIVLFKNDRNALCASYGPLNSVNPNINLLIEEKREVVS